MVIHAQGGYPRHAHNSGEVREIEIVTEKRRQTNREGRDSCKQGDPARKRARRKKQQDGARKCDVNRPGDVQSALKSEKGYNVTKAEARASRGPYGFGIAEL